MVGLKRHPLLTREVPPGTMSAMPTLHLSQDPDADALLGQDPLALLLGMLLDPERG